MICSIVTASAAIVALALSAAQVRVSNKQQLLDRRLCLWIKTHGLMELCDKNRSFLAKKENKPETTNNLIFLWMTNNSLLCDIGPAVENVLEQDWQRPLLTKLEELKEMAFEAELVFKGRSAEALGMFIADYAALLMSMYQYQIMLKHLREANEQCQHDLKKAVTAVGEDEQRAELYVARDKLLNSFDKLTPCTVERIISQCRLSVLS